MRQTIPISALQRTRIADLHTTLQRAQQALDLFCDAILTGQNINTAQVVDLTAAGLIVDLPDPPEAIP